MKKSEILEQIEHILVTNKKPTKVFIAELEKLIKGNETRLNKIIKRDLKFHGREADKHLEMHKRNKSGGQFKKHLRHLFIAKYIEELLKTSIMDSWWRGDLTLEAASTTLGGITF